MGKGDGKGKCDSGGCCSGEAATPEGKQSWIAAIVTTVAEAIGLLINCICCCHICCGAGCGVCFCMLISGVVNVTGASAPACCKSEKIQNMVFGITGIVSLVFRIIAVIYLSIVASQWEQIIDDSEACQDEQEEANCDYWNDDGICGEDCQEDCYAYTCDNDDAWLNALKVIIGVTAIWIIFSILGIVCGFRACVAEGNAPAPTTVSQSQVVVASAQAMPAAEAVVVVQQQPVVQQVSVTPVTQEQPPPQASPKE